MGDRCCTAADVAFISRLGLRRRCGATTWKAEPGRGTCSCWCGWAAARATYCRRTRKFPDRESARERSAVALTRWRHRAIGQTVTCLLGAERDLYCLRGTAGVQVGQGHPSTRRLGPHRCHERVGRVDGLVVDL